MFQEASYHHNHHKPGDTSGIFENNVTSFLELHNTIYAAAVATVRKSGARIEKKNWTTYKIKHKPHHGKEGPRNKLRI
jgi:hypothetical protein